MRIALVALLATWVFFFEYIPPTKRVHLWSDLQGYHYPLLSYAHKSLWEGRAPLWDPSIYCGIPFAGNVQAGLFYPPNWLLFVANAKMPLRLHEDLRGQQVAGMRFLSIELLAFLHVWLTFLFTYFWLRERTSGWLPAALGGGVAAFSGYMLSQLNHLGVISGYAWIPFALWGIEQANRKREWIYLWKVAVAAALCLLAGYPPTLVAMCLISLTYAAALDSRKRLVPLTAGALVFAALLAAVQLLPLMEATKMKQPEVSFGDALPFGNGFYASLLMPNWFDQNRLTSGPDLYDGDYLYLGVPFLFGLIWLLRGRWFPGAGPALFLGGVTLFIAADPAGLVLRAIEPLPVVPDVIRRYYLVPGIVLAAALLAASAVDDFLRRTSRRPVPKAVPFVWLAIIAVWTTYLVRTDHFRAAWASALYPAVLLVLFSWGLYLMRSQRRMWIAAALVLAVAAEFQAFGSNRRFTAVDGQVDRDDRGDARLGGARLNGLDDTVYQEMLRHPGYRLALDDVFHSTDLRHYKLATLQGFDPFLPAAYKAAVERFIPFATNRLFEVNPFDEAMLRHFGVRWVMTHNDKPMAAALKADPRFRKLHPAESYFIVFEYLNAKPAWRFDGHVRMNRWDPEHRSFHVRSASGGKFVLVEQFFPGWKASIDGKDTPVERADGTFQGINVPLGDHTVEFRYAPASVYAGATISLGALVLLMLVLRKARRTRSSTHSDVVVPASLLTRAAQQ